MPNPTGSDDAKKPDGEWVELYNLTDKDLDLSGWLLHDAKPNQRLLIAVENVSTGKVCIPANGYLVVYRNGGGDFSLNNSGDESVVLVNESGETIDEVTYNGSAGGKSWSRVPDGSSTWVADQEPTPQTQDSPCVPPAPSDPASEEPATPEPAISFSSPTSVAAGSEFTVTVNLSNFEAGTYALKVLVGKDGSFIYGNTKGSSGWLSQNGAWKDMPQIPVGSSNKTIQAKVDEDALPGSYAIAVSVAKKDGDSYKALWATKDLETKPLKVTVAVVESENEGEVTEVEGTEELQIGLEDVGGGEVLGEVNQEGKKKFTLNFYLVTGIFGLLVGGAGLFFGFRYLP